MSAQPSTLAAPAPSAAPVFLTGIGRSGTTLCGEMLNVHSELAIAQESSFMTLVLLSLRNFSFPDERRAGLERAVVRLVYEAYAESQGKRRFGDKIFSPIEPLDRAFDGTPRYVWMVRHPVDVAESWAERLSLVETMRILHAQPVPAAGVREADACLQRRMVLQALTTSARYLLRLLEQRGFGKRIMVCRYEDLAANPEKTLLRLCEFLGVEYEAAMIDGARFGARGVARGDVKKFRNVIDAGSVGRWTKLSGELRSLYTSSLRSEVRAALEALAAAGIDYGWDDRTS